MCVCEREVVCVSTSLCMGVCVCERERERARERERERENVHPLHGATIRYDRPSILRQITRIYMCVYACACACVYACVLVRENVYEMATISRLPKNIGLFCRRTL